MVNFITSPEYIVIALILVISICDGQYGMWKNIALDHSRAFE